MAVMVFDDGHIWCTKKHDDTWYDLDSLSNGPRPVEFQNIFSRKGFGWIIVWNNSRSILNEQSFESSTVNQSVKSSSKRNRMKGDAAFDESF